MAPFRALPDMADLLTFLTALVERNTVLVWLLFAASASSMAAVALFLPGMVARLPADYFASSHSTSTDRMDASKLVRWTGRNVLGVVFVLGGLGMLLLPGQGLLTILVGVFLLDFPGKRALERAVVRRDAVKKMLNRIRAKRGQPPLRLD
jgi:hypothetical protein